MSTNPSIVSSPESTSSSPSFFSTLFKSPVERINLALESGDEDLVWRYLKKYSHHHSQVLNGAIRGKIWLMLTSSPNRKLKCCPEFEDSIRSSPNFRTLTNDMARTWGFDISSSNQSEDELESFRNDLKMILISLWKENKRVSYCQGIHSICNMLYDEMGADLDATLSVLHGIIEELRVGGLYIHEPPLTALQHCADLIFDYLSVSDVVLCEAIDKLDFVNILAHWFMSGFVGVLSREVVHYLFDGLICDGIISFFAAAIAILKLHRAEILSKSRDPAASEGSLLLSIGLGNGIVVEKSQEKYFMKVLESLQEELLVAHNFDEKIEMPLFHDDGFSTSSYYSSSSSMLTDSTDSSNCSVSRNRASSDVSDWSVAESSVPPQPVKTTVDLEEEDIKEPPLEEEFDLLEIDVECETKQDEFEDDEEEVISKPSVLSWLFSPRRATTASPRTPSEEFAIGKEDVFDEHLEP